VSAVHYYTIVIGALISKVTVKFAVCLVCDAVLCSG